MSAKQNHVRNPRPPVGLLRTAAHLKEPAVRSGYLAGMTVPRLADAFGVTEFVMRDYVALRRWGWDAAGHRGIQEDERRIVTFSRIAREGGGYDVRPISLARISMHVNALEDRAHA